MLRAAALLLFFALAPYPALGDQASSFFDDSAVREIRLYFDDANWYNTLFNSHNSNPDDPYFPARIVYGSVTIPKIGARFKGNSSFRRNGVKKPFKLDFNEYDDNATFYGLKKLNLHNGDLQPDHLHEKLFLDFAGKYIAAMRAVHVRLYVNDVYYGLYLAVEQPDGTMMKSRYGDDEDGNLYEAGESVSATMSYLGSSPSAYTSRYELKTNETANDYSGLIQMLDILNNTATAELPARIEPMMDIENIMAGMALNALFTNVESYLGTASEYFLYQRSRDNRFTHIHWDTNETFGSTGDGTPRVSNVFTMDPFTIPTEGGVPGGGGPGGGTASGRPLLEKLWAVDAYKRVYLQLLARFLREGFDETTFSTRSQQLANLIRADYTADPNKAYTMAQFESALTSQVTANGFTTYGITQFVRERRSYLRSLLNGYARSSDVRLNEVGPAGGAQRDAAGDADPWLELHNLGPGAVSTSGFFLSDDQANPNKWALPARTLNDGDFLLLWLDGEAAEGDTHAGFRLSSTGGTLYLYANGTLIDSVTYGAIPAAQSYARTGAFGSTWSATGTQTASAANTITVPTSTPVVTSGNGRLLINELMADNDASFADPDESGAYDDWFEVYNPGSSAVDMGGMYISDSLNNPTKWQVPTGVSIPAGGHLVFIADSTTAQGSRHTSWSLSADGESISIYESDGKTLVDTVSFGPQWTDVAYGRSSDGAAGWSLFQPGTAGAANANPMANWIVNGAGYQAAPMAPESIASAFMSGLAGSAAWAGSIPLPVTLGGLSATLADSANAVRSVPLFYVSSTQVNLQIPAGAAAGKARLSFVKQDGSAVAGDVLISAAAPGVFSANSSGAGVGVITAIHVSAQGAQTAQAAYQYDSASQKYVTSPISLGADTEQVHLVLYTTGVRGVAATKVTATVGGVSVPVTYAGAQPEYQGLDQVNLGPLPRSLAGKGDVAVLLTVDGHRSNSVSINVQ